jgi:hypothetical protein
VPLATPNWRAKSRHDLQALRALPDWNGGRNVVIVDQSDAPILFSHRSKYGLDHALVAQSHAEEGEFVHGFDISIPIGFSPLAETPWQTLLPLRHLDAPRGREYWISYKGSLTLERTTDGVQRHALLWLQHVQSVRRGRVGVYLHCHDPSHTLASKRRGLGMCSAARQRYERAPPYRALLNTSFVLCPIGRSPASYRMNEALAAGAIPIFVSGDVLSGAPYVTPVNQPPTTHYVSIPCHWAMHDLMRRRPPFLVPPLLTHA